MEVSGQPRLVLLFKLLVLQEVGCHDPVDLLEVLEDCEAWELLLVGHVLVEVVVGVHLWGCSAHFVECPSRLWRGRGETLCVNGLIKHLLVPRRRSTKHVLPLSEDLTVVLSGLDFLVIIHTLLLLRLLLVFVLVHHAFESQSLVLFVERVLIYLVSADLRGSILL